MAALRDIMEDFGIHHPVLLDEVIAGLNIKSQGYYVDGTFGRGGHAAAILSHLDSAGKLIALDKDPQAVSVAKQRFAGDTRFSIQHGSFTNLQTVVNQQNLNGKVDGILLDLGVSSPQLDEAARGFSFLRDGTLDMRMDTSKGIDAATWIASVREAELMAVLKDYGEERFARRIARAIIIEREIAPITTTLRLAEIIKKANPAWEKDKHPATRGFLAIRIAINQELDELTQCLDQCLEVLAVGGRLVVISFHSLEDRIVKRFIQRHESGDDFPAGLPVTQAQLKRRLKRLGRAIKPSAQEVARNPRARSAILRIAEKLA